MIHLIRKWRGCFVADVVGLGKSYIGSAVVKHFERTEGVRPLIICPAGLVKMWDRYNEIYQLNARVLSQGLLLVSFKRRFLPQPDDGTNFLLEDIEYRDRDFILVDESHNFRHSNTQRYQLLQGFLNTGRRCLFLTATPRNKSLWDVYNQIKLFHPDERTDLPIDPPNLRSFFREIESGSKQLPEILRQLLIRRTRNHILRWYGFDAETDEPMDPSRFHEYLDGTRRAYILVGGKKQFFPKRELETITYSIEDTYQGLYQKLRSYLGRAHRKQTSPSPDELTYARYGLWHYVKRSKQKESPYTELHQAGANLRGLMRVMLFKRLESSIHAFRETLHRMLRIHKDFLAAIDQGIVPAGEEAQKLLYESDLSEEMELIDALRKLSGKYKIEDFRSDLLKERINQDINIISEMLSLVEPIKPENDAKLQKLISLLLDLPLKDGKRLIFTQYADTARYLYENLNPDDKHDDIDVIYSGEKSRDRVVGRFAPKANSWYNFREGESELLTVIATDVLSEGLNLQDCDKVINYDLHWNPVRLIQRFGRIDRIGSEHDKIFAFNFLPELGIEKQLGLREKLKYRIAEIHETIGEDAAILDPTEQVNEEAMYAIYEKDGKKLSQFEEVEEKMLDLNEAEELLRQMRQENSEEFERIANLRDGIRSGKKCLLKESGKKRLLKETGVKCRKEGIFAFFKAGLYHQLILLDEDGNIVSRDMSDAVGAIQCNASESTQPLPSDYNNTLMKAKRRFDKEAKERQSKRDYTASLTLGQRYVVKELKALFESTKEEDTRREIAVLEEAFRRAITSAVKKELNLLRRNEVTGDNLLQALKKIYFQHKLEDKEDKLSRAGQEVPRIVCSMALV